MHQNRGKSRHFPREWGRCPDMNEKSSNEKRLAALGSRGRGPPRSGGRAWSFRLLDFHRHSAGGNNKCGERGLWNRCPDKPRWRESFRKKADLISTFTMSSTLPKCIALIVKRIHFGDLLDCPLFATKPPFHPRSSRCSFSKCLYTKYFPKHALLDLPRSLMTRGKVYRNRRKSRHFPRRWKRQVRREGSVEQVARQARGESVPKSWEIPALSGGKTTMACGSLVAGGVCGGGGFGKSCYI